MREKTRTEEGTKGRREEGRETRETGGGQQRVQGPVALCGRAPDRRPTRTFRCWAHLSASRLAGRQQRVAISGGAHAWLTAMVAANGPVMVIGHRLGPILTGDICATGRRRPAQRPVREHPVVVVPSTTAAMR